MEFINILNFKFKNNAFAALKNCKASREKQFGYKLKIFYSNRKKEYIREFDDYFNKNSNTHEVTAFYLLEQIEKVKKVNCIIIAPIWAILA